VHFKDKQIQIPTDFDKNKNVMELRLDFVLSIEMMLIELNTMYLHQSTKRDISQSITINLIFAMVRHTDRDFRFVVV